MAGSAHDSGPDLRRRRFLQAGAALLGSFALDGTARGADPAAAPSAYTRGDTDFVRLCEAEDLDLVFTA